MSDVNLISRYETSTGHTEAFATIGYATPTPDWDDSLKLTRHISDYFAFAEAIYGGREDCVDIHNGASAVRVQANRWVPQGKYLATIKGGVVGAKLSGHVYAHGKEVDVDIGNRSTTNKEVTTGVILDLYSQTGKPITVRVLNGDKPSVVDGSGPYKYVFPNPDSWYHGIVVWFFRLW